MYNTTILDFVKCYFNESPHIHNDSVWTISYRMADTASEVIDLTEKDRLFVYQGGRGNKMSCLVFLLAVFATIFSHEQTSRQCLQFFET